MPIYYTNNPSEWLALEGVYIANIDQPSPANIVSSAGLTKVVADFPWGPVDEVITVTNGSEFEKIFGRAQNPENYGGYKGIIGKTWGELQVVRAGDSGHAKAAVTVRDPGVASVDTYDTGDDFTLDITVGGTTHSFTVASADHSSTDDVVNSWATQVNAADIPVVAEADTSSDVTRVGGDGDESWTGAVSVTGTGSGASSWTSPEDSYTVTAAHPGAVGDEIQVIHHYIDDSTFEIEIVWSDASNRYGPFDYDGSQSAEDNVNDATQFVDFAWDANWSSSPTPDPILDQSTGVNLSGGADATIADNQPYIDAIDKIEEADEGGTLLAMEVPFADAQNSNPDETENNGIIARLQSYASKFPKTLALAQVAADSGNTGAYNLENNNTVADNYADDNLILFNHRVKQFIRGDLLHVDLAPFVASALSQIAEHKSPAAFNSAGEYYSQIRAYEDGIAPGRPDRVEAREIGVNMAIQEPNGQWRLHYGVTTDIGGDNELISTKRMEVFVGENVALATLPFQNEPPLPTNVDGAQSAIDRKLELLEGSPDVPPSRMIKDFSNEIAEQNDQYTLYKQRVELWGEMGTIVNAQQVGERVNIPEE